MGLGCGATPRVACLTRCQEYEVSYYVSNFRAVWQVEKWIVG